MNLLNLQQLFTRKLADLIIFAYNKGYEVTLGEVYRPPETAYVYSKQGKGSVNSLHCQRLAADMNLFKADMYLTRCSDYEELGQYWKSFSTPEIEFAWGGDFKGKTAGDAGHFSISFQGRK
jgi:hypothetical protein